MKALTLWQPWASLIAVGDKTIETRSWSTKYRGPLAIHAAARPIGNVALSVGRWTNVTGEPIARGQQAMSGGVNDLLVCPLGAIVATANLADVVPIRGPRAGMGRSLHNERLGPDNPTAAFIGEYPQDGPHEYQRGGLWLIGTTNLTRGNPTHIEAQRPYGDFEPGRYAWLLTDIHELAAPVPCKGRQGLWNPGPDLVRSVLAQAA